MLLPAEQDLTAYSNGFFEATLTLTNQETGAPIDLTGMSAKLALTTLYGVPASLSINSTTATSNDSQITFPNQTAGQVKLFIAQADIASLGANKLQQDFVYDLLLIDITNEPAPYVRGIFSIVPGVSA